MQVVCPCCCDLDVHKKSITACVLWVEARGEKHKEKRVFGTWSVRSEASSERRRG